MTPEYLLPSQFSLMLASTYSFTSAEPFSSPEPVVSWSQQNKPSGSWDENECEHNLAPEQALFVAFFQGSEGKLEASMERFAPASRFLCTKKQKNNGCFVYY